MMERNLGGSGLRVSLAGLGCSNFGVRLDLGASRAVVHAALDHGVTFFDTADNYGDWQSESLLGEILGDRRKDVVLATKFGTRRLPSDRRRDASRRYIMTAVEASLTRLRTDWIDLYQLHWPDPLTPMEETLRALDDLVRQGKVRYVGCSNLPAWQIVEAEWISRSVGLAAFISCQDEYSLLCRRPEEDLIPAMERYHLSLLPYLPLAGGLLTGKYRRGEAPPSGSRLSSVSTLAERYLTDSNWTMLDRLGSVSARYDRSPLETALGWLASRPTVASVIAAASTPEQLGANCRALERPLPADMVSEIDRLTSPRELAG